MPARITDEGVDVTTLDVPALLELCQDGDASACAELDRRGVEPPVLDVDHIDVPAASRAETLALLGGTVVGHTLIGLETDRAGNATLRFDNGVVVVLPADGDLRVIGVTAVRHTDPVRAAAAADPRGEADR